MNSYRITFRKAGRQRSLSYDGRTQADAERDFYTDHPDATDVVITRESRSVHNIFSGTATAPVIQMGDHDGDVNFFRG